MESLLGGIQGRLRRDKRPGANARVLSVFGAEIRGPNLNSGNQCEQR